MKNELFQNIYQLFLVCISALRSVMNELHLFLNKTRLSCTTSFDLIMFKSLSKHFSTSEITLFPFLIDNIINTDY